MEFSALKKLEQALFSKKARFGEKKGLADITAQLAGVHTCSR